MNGTSETNRASESATDPLEARRKAAEASYRALFQDIAIGAVTPERAAVRKLELQLELRNVALALDIARRAR